MINLNTLYLLFIFTGLSIILTLLYLRYLTKRTFRVVLECIGLNEQCGYDLGRFLPSIIPLLQRAGIEDLFYRIDYLNSVLEREKTGRKHGLQKSSERGDYRVLLGIVPRVYRGERRYLYQIALELLFLLVEMDVLIKLKAVNEAFYNFSKLQTFMLHDVKNLTQFIKSLSYNLDHLPDREREERFMQFLRQSSPGLVLRANKILSILEMGGVEETELQEMGHVNLRNLLEGLAASYHLPCQVRGEGDLVAEEYKVAAIFDNIIKNIYEKTLREQGIDCSMEIEGKKESISVVITDTGRHLDDPKRIFEPFYSMKREGLGIGLFQARSLVISLGGTMRAENLETGVAFEVVLPKAPVKTED